MRRLLFCICLAGLLIPQLVFSQNKEAAQVNMDNYVCMPCGNECDNKIYSAGGKCEQCQMELVRQFTVAFKTINPEDICSYITSHPLAVLLDVRTKEEFEGKADPDFGTLKNAINIPVQELQARVGELKKYKNREIIVYCSHSRRSPRASYMLMQMGFANVYNMAGGMSVFADGSCKK